MTPSQRSLAIRGHALEYLVGIASEVVEHMYHGGVHEIYAAALAEPLKFHEEHWKEEHSWHEFNEMVIRDDIVKTVGKILAL